MNSLKVINTILLTKCWYTDSNGTRYYRLWYNILNMWITIEFK